MEEPAVNRWTGKSTEDVLGESYHELRERITLAAGYLNVLRSANQLSLTTEQSQQYLESAFSYIVQAQTVVDSVYQYMNEKRKDS